MTAYVELQARFARIATIGEAQAILGWDAATMMPRGGGAARGDQLAVLAGLSHQLLTAPDMAYLLTEAESTERRDQWDATNLALMRRTHTRAVGLPQDLVEARARANSACEKVWRKARAENDFAMVSPYLAEVVSLVRHEASAIGAALGLDPYDALMDNYQPGIGAAEASKIFDRYEAFMTWSLPLAEERQRAKPVPQPLTGSFQADHQERFCRELAYRAGLSFDHTRLDRSTHPFCGGSPTDIRITTRYDENNPATALLGVLHETGHALYESGLPTSRARQPVGRAAGMGVHESQSLIIEMQACRSDQFLAWLGPELHRNFGGDLAPYAAPNLERLWRRVDRGLIRVDADEVTYPAHVILRFRLEQALISGALAVVDLPGAWHDGLKSLLDITPTDDTRGCLQDIHWYDGAFGYFPSYTLGAMAAAQFIAAARREVSNLDDALGEGDLQPLVEWLRLRVHSQGSLLGFNALLLATTGSELDPAFFEAHLSQRYLAEI